MNNSLALAAFAFAALAAPSLASAAPTDPLTCTVAVTSTLNNTTALVYNQTFTVSTTTPYFDDFSTATRFRFFDASVTIEDNLPVVAISLDADVSVFDTIDFTTSLKVRDSHGESTAGTNSFFTSNRSIRTSYSLSCAREK